MVVAGLASLASMLGQLVLGVGVEAAEGRVCVCV